MAFYAYRKKTEHNHENEQFSKLCRLLEKEYKDSNEDVYLLGSCQFSKYSLHKYREGCLFEEQFDIDALIIRASGIVVVEFKAYSGELTDYKMMQPWFIRDENNQRKHIMEDHEYNRIMNPNQQVRRNALGFIHQIQGHHKNENLYDIEPIDLFDLSHVRDNTAKVLGFAVFQELTNDEEFYTGIDLDREMRPWFRIVDTERVVYCLKQMSSTPIHLNKVPDLIKKFNLDYYSHEEYTIPENTSVVFSQQTAIELAENEPTEISRDIDLKSDLNAFFQPIKSLLKGLVKRTMPYTLLFGGVFSTLFYYFGFSIWSVFLIFTPFALASMQDFIPQQNK